jgi:hypothetical protein
MIRFQTDDCLTPEEEAEIDARYAEQQVEEWLAAWSEDFWSDGWLGALPLPLVAAGMEVAV